MSSPGLDDEIDRLYQLPLEEFTAARNLLAKSGGAGVRSLVKPPVAAWAVNQLYWKQGDVYAALIEVSEEVRRTHRAVLGGKPGDLRAAGKAHDEAVEAALKATLSWLDKAGQPATESTRQGVLTTLRALPANEPPGRLTRVLQPGGFEMLAGFSIAGGGRVPAAPAKPAAKAKAAAGKSEPAAKGKMTAAEKAARDKAEVKAREAIAAATRDLRQAEHAARREEFEAARTSREAEKAERQAVEARTAFEEAQAALEEAEAAVPPALRAREAAARRARQADEKAQTLRDKLEAAQTRL